MEFIDVDIKKDKVDFISDAISKKYLSGSNPKWSLNLNKKDINDDSYKEISKSIKNRKKSGKLFISNQEINWEIYIEPNNI